MDAHTHTHTHKLAGESSGWLSDDMKRFESPNKLAVPSGKLREHQLLSRIRSLSDLQLQ